jgi:hypothetical protein
VSRTRNQPTKSSVRESLFQQFSHFALIFTALFLLHATLLRLPYFWDEAGYFVPAAWDFYRTGDLIPHTTLSNAHPPLVMIWLAFWWKFSNFAPAVTRTAMLLSTASGLFALFKLARHVSNSGVAVAVVALTALYPVFFAQSSMAQLDIGVFAVMTWGLYFYVTQKQGWSVVFLALACVAKETAVVTPLTLCAWELISNVLWKRRSSFAQRWCMPPKSAWKSVTLLLALLPLCLWYGYHFHRTGHVFGNPEYLRYNVGATLTPLRVAMAALMRLWHVFGYMNMFVLTGLALLALRLSPLRANGSVVDEAPRAKTSSHGHSDASSIRPRIPLPMQVIFFLLIAAHVAEFSILGGALLARYMVPVIGLWILMAVSTLHRRLAEWPIWCLAAAAAFLFALVVNPPWRIAPEDNLAYADFVRIHRSASAYLQTHYAEDRILTAWPASDEINRPFLGYVAKPMTVVRVENFTAAQIIPASQRREDYDVVFAFSSKYDPPRLIMNRFACWNRLQERYFDYHQDMVPADIAAAVHGRIAWQQQRGGEWAAIIELDKARLANLHTRAFPSSRR